MTRLQCTVTGRPSIQIGASGGRPRCASCGATNHTPAPARAAGKPIATVCCGADHPLRWRTNGYGHYAHVGTVRCDLKPDPTRTTWR